MRHIPRSAIRRLAMGFIRPETEDAMTVEAYAVGSSLPPSSAASNNRRTSPSVMHAMPASSIQVPLGGKRPNARDVDDDDDGQTAKRLRP